MRGGDGSHRLTDTFDHPTVGTHNASHPITSVRWIAACPSAHQFPAWNEIDDTVGPLFVKDLCRPCECLFASRAEFS